LFEQATALDPASAKAQAGIAGTYLTQPNSLAAVSPDEARAKSATAVARALALGPEEAAAHTAAAQARRIAHDWAGAVREHRRAIELGPNDPAAHVAYSATLGLIGDFETALREARRAQALDGLSPVNQEAVAAALRLARRYDEAIVEARKVLDLDPTYGPAYHTLGQCYEATGRVEDAIGYYERDGQPNGNRGHAYAAAGRTADARALLATFEARYKQKGTGAGEIAMVYIGLGEHDRAFEWLERAVAGGTPLTLKTSSVWDPLRGDPRFEVLLDRLDLGEHSRGVVIATAAR
jgi:tetratricopeptide (TPR) repeat protein